MSTVVQKHLKEFKCSSSKTLLSPKELDIYRNSWSNIHYISKFKLPRELQRNLRESRVRFW